MDLVTDNSTKQGAILTQHGESYQAKKKFTCECLKCSHTLKTDKHCIDLKCPKCGGQMRRKERPGPGQEKFALIGSPSEPPKKPAGTYVCIECGDVRIVFHTPQDEYKTKCPKCSAQMVRAEKPLTV